MRKEEAHAQIVTYIFNPKVNRITREKAQLLDGLADDELAEITPEMLAEEIEGYNETICECKKHIEMQVAQREEINNLKEEVKNDLHVSFDLKTMLFFIEMYGTECTYPLSWRRSVWLLLLYEANQSLLIWSDEPIRRENEHYIWEEREANRGADNVISCL